MCLALLALQRMFLACIVRVNTRLVSRVVAVALHMRLVPGNHGLIHSIQSLDSKFEVLDQAVASVHAEIFADDNAHHLQLLAMRRHGVSRHNPSSLA